VASPHIILLLAATPTADAAAFYFCKPTTEHPGELRIHSLLLTSHSKISFFFWFSSLHFVVLVFGLFVQDPAAVNELLPAAAVNELLLISVICC